METSVDDFVEAGKQVVDEFARIIVRNMVEGIVAFIRATPLTMAEWQRISDALEDKVRPQPLITMEEFLEETGLDPEYELLDEAFRNFTESGERFWLWWRNNQRKYT